MISAMTQKQIGKLKQGCLLALHQNSMFLQGARVMVQWLRPFAIPPEDPRLTYSTHVRCFMPLPRASLIDSVSVTLQATAHT